ncbi:MAG: D-isomer specific 2-hydroxyacid dehydrogenase family protein [Lachnotalea sp.]
MRILVYDVMEFEKEILKKIASQTSDELVCKEFHLTMDTVFQAEGFDGVSVLGHSQVTEDILEKIKEYGITQLSTRTIGFDHIDVKKAKELGIHVSHANYEPNNVADFTVMMMLILLRKAKISICRALVNDFSLDGIQGREVRNLTVGVIGTGKIGATVIKNLSGFGCKILAYDLYKNPNIEGIAEYVDLDVLYRESDIITLHTPLTEDNYRMIDKETISKMKKGVILINTARGGLINTDDLIEALETEYIGGAGIDTLEEEAGIIHIRVGTGIVKNRQLLYLKQFPNVLFTQHYAFYTEEATESMVRCGIESIQNGINGCPNPCEIIIK